MKPRFGLIRAKEFVMKDMYTFDGSEKAARYTYDLVSESYAAVLKRLNLDYLKGNLDSMRSFVFIWTFSFIISFGSSFYFITVWLFYIVTQ